ncbi:MAG: glucose dehydrogenase [Spirochaetae bacterium HGW-Spirochaetae-5]|nr:MAG: glucose dehydrogenase [Spirochaetae bacterium HGW-Spirochaetae-5]
MKRISIYIILSLLISCGHSNVDAGGIYKSEKTSYKLELLYGGLVNPWSMAFIPEGIIITERQGRMKKYKDGKIFDISGLPDIAPGGQGGLLDVVPSPSFSRDREIFFTFSRAGKGGRGTALASAKLTGLKLENVKILWEMEDKSSMRAQDLSDSAGKVHRINRDGSIPGDNPFIKKEGAVKSIYSYGHRNAQGLSAAHDGTIWLSEHGPQGGDEINIVLPGRNYGWPIITYGRNYGIGTKIGEGTFKPGMEQPLIYWTPSIAPSGLDFYTGSLIPEWRGNLFSGALAGRRLVRMEISGKRITSQEILLQGEIGRIRDVRQGPDGYIYILTDESNGGLYRLGPGK